MLMDGDGSHCYTVKTCRLNLQYHGWHLLISLTSSASSKIWKNFRVLENIGSKMYVNFDILVNRMY